MASSHRYLFLLTHFDSQQVPKLDALRIARGPGPAATWASPHWPRALATPCPAAAAAASASCCCPRSRPPLRRLPLRGSLAAQEMGPSGKDLSGSPDVAVGCVMEANFRLKELVFFIPISVGEPLSFGACTSRKKGPNQSSSFTIHPALHNRTPPIQQDYISIRSGRNWVEHLDFSASQTKGGSETSESLNLC